MGGGQRQQRTIRVFAVSDHAHGAGCVRCPTLAEIFVLIPICDIFSRQIFTPLKAEDGETKIKSIKNTILSVKIPSERCCWGETSTEAMFPAKFPAASLLSSPSSPHLQSPSMRAAAGQSRPQPPPPLRNKSPPHYQSITIAN